MRAEHHKANNLTRNTLVQQIAHGEEVAKRLGHLLALDLQHFVVHPNVREPVANTLALGDLVLMMREHQIITAAVNVKTLAQQFVRHGGAFDMPARTPLAPWAVPPRRVSVRRLPKYEIHRITLIGCHFDARSCDHVVNAATRELTIIGITFDREQNMALRLISETFFNKIRAHIDHWLNIFRRTRHMRGMHRADRIHVVQI